MPVVAVSGYACLFCGCCVPNPTTKMVLYEEDCEDDDRYDDNELDIVPRYCYRTMVPGMVGTIGTVIGLVSMGGCFGTCSPRQCGL
jgi:hypothetical protein